MNQKVVRVGAFDGQTIWLDRFKAIPLYDLSNYLGGGVAGTVYQCEDKKGNHFAVKILNPLGYKLLPPGLLRRCVVIRKGEPFSDSPDEILCVENIWWLIHATTKQYIAAYFTQKHGLKELQLSQCMDVWDNDLSLLNVSEDDQLESTDSQSGSSRMVIPSVPQKYVDFLRKRDHIFREINNMYKIPAHTNVISLHKVLEFSESTKSTIFLVMELANGGELFDQIKIDHGTDEDVAKFFFLQVLEGVRHCHSQGVCHRDLKPENLLLVEAANGKSVLKIADFGFSSRFIDINEEGEASADVFSEHHFDHGANHLAVTPDAARALSQIPQSPLRVLKSVVGSPFYVAPEVLQSVGYDGAKADMWSMGIILYAMLAGNLPFDQEITTCKRFQTFSKWAADAQVSKRRLWEDSELELPSWLFPAKFSTLVRRLLAGLLHPDPAERLSVYEAKRHAWCGGNHHLHNQSLKKFESLIDPKMEVVKEELDDEYYDDDYDVDEYVEDYVEEVDEFAPEEEFFSMEDDTADRDRKHSFDTFDIVEATLATLHRESLASSPKRISSSIPPVAPLLVSMGPVVADLFTEDFDDREINSNLKSHGSFFSHVGMGDDPSFGDSSGHGNSNPPNFNDIVKRSTRFVTYVPAIEVMEYLVRILNECRDRGIVTPIGCFGEIQVFHDSFRIEMRGPDMALPPVCAVQIYIMPSSHQSPYERSNHLAIMPRQMYLVEFVRVQVEIFPFKRFFVWLKQQLADVIKQQRHATDLNDKDISLMSYGNPSPIMQHTAGAKSA